MQSFRKLFFNVLNIFSFKWSINEVRSQIYQSFHNMPHQQQILETALTRTELS